jgi:Fe-S-cluster containining protein
MVAECKTTSHLLKRVAEIYNWLGSQINNNSNLAGVCNACGECCDFAKLDHHLFVTTPELMYLAAKLGAENIKPMTTSRCPYNVRGKCSVYEHRFSGCRIFFCKGDADFQSRLSESALKRFKSICREFQISYRYTDLATALNSFTVA